MLFRETPGTCGAKTPAQAGHMCGMHGTRAVNVLFRAEGPRLWALPHRNTSPQCRSAGRSRLSKHAAADATTARGLVHCAEPRAGEAVSGVEIITFFVRHVGPPQKPAVPPLGPVWPVAWILAQGVRLARSAPDPQSDLNKTTSHTKRRFWWCWCSCRCVIEPTCHSLRKEIGIDQVAKD